MLVITKFGISAEAGQHYRIFQGSHTLIAGKAVLLRMYVRWCSPAPHTWIPTFFCSTKSLAVGDLLFSRHASMHCRTATNWTERSSYFARSRSPRCNRPQSGHSVRSWLRRADGPPRPWFIDQLSGVDSACEMRPVGLAEPDSTAQFHAFSFLAPASSDRGFEPAPTPDGGSPRLLRTADPRRGCCLDFFLWPSVFCAPIRHRLSSREA